ncbi:unnamed protein product [Zymoseptoria tritici ST99CH_1A5]|uniref:Uncharacterized protein n=1 Tax=Zymoseptoria tritici ST99CH_1A5 TaxID=1276529 RepID=A0A1Y6M5A1_ZYMTR|nr:unnamed protein product [Zymoseptoria tritici ST99CH_1A5]
MSVSTLLCTKLGLRCHRTTTVPLEVVFEVIQASRSFIQRLADANKLLTLLIVFTILMVVALLGIIGVGVVDGDVRAAYRARLAVISSGIKGGFLCVAHYVSTAFTELPSVTCRLIAPLRSHSSIGANWTATHVPLCRNIPVERFSDSWTLVNTPDPTTQRPNTVKEEEKDIQIGWNMVEK